MVKHAQTIRRQIADELFDLFDHFVGLALKGVIMKDQPSLIRNITSTPLHLFDRP